MRNSPLMTIVRSNVEDPGTETGPECVDSKDNDGDGSIDCVDGNADSDCQSICDALAAMPADQQAQVASFLSRMASGGGGRTSGGGGRTSYQGNPDCWGDGFTFERCCDASKGANGDATCWDGAHTFETCACVNPSPASKPKPAPASAPAPAAPMALDAGASCTTAPAPPGQPARRARTSAAAHAIAPSDCCARFTLAGPRHLQGRPEVRGPAIWNRVAPTGPPAKPWHLYVGGGRGGGGRYVCCQYRVS